MENKLPVDLAEPDLEAAAAADDLPVLTGDDRDVVVFVPYHEAPPEAQVEDLTTRLADVTSERDELLVTLEDARTQLGEKDARIGNLIGDLGLTQHHLQAARETIDQLRLVIANERDRADAAVAVATAEARAALEATLEVFNRQGTLWEIAWQGGRSLVAGTSIEDAIAKFRRFEPNATIVTVKASETRVLV